MQDYFDENDEFSAQNGLEFAVSFVSTSARSNSIDPRYGKITIVKVTYDSKNEDKWELIQSHDCTESELGFNQESTKIMPFKKTKGYVENLKYKCIDSSDTKISGSWT